MNSSYYFLYLFSVFIAAFSQVLLKISANKNYTKKINEWLNPLVVTAYGIFFISMILTTLALKGVPYKMGGVIESCSYLFVLIFSISLLKERVTKKRLWGNALIILGMIVFNL